VVFGPADSEDRRLPVEHARDSGLPDATPGEGDARRWFEEAVDVAPLRRSLEHLGVGLNEG
jgi:hypothetical protein